MFTATLGDVIINWVFRATAIGTPPTSIDIALWITNPGILALDGYEVSGPVETTGYERQSVICDEIFTGWFPGIGGISILNSAAITWDEALSYWGEVTHVVMFAGGTVTPFFYGPLLSPKDIDEGSIVRFAATALTVTLV